MPTTFPIAFAAAAIRTVPDAVLGTDKLSTSLLKKYP
jgi:hypothetical protein